MRAKYLGGMVLFLSISLFPSLGIAGDCLDMANQFIKGMNLPPKDSKNCVERINILLESCLALCKSPPCDRVDAGLCSTACKGQYDITKRCKLTNETSSSGEF